MDKKLVRVTWDDTEDPKPGWQDEDELKAFDAEDDCLVVSVGWVVSHGPKYLTLCADWIEKLKHSGRVTKILIAQIVKVEDL